jgi:hypothetical protein
MHSFHCCVNNSLVSKAVVRHKSRAHASSFDQGLPSIARLPSFFNDHGYSSPDDYLAGPFQYGHNTNMETYSYWLTRPNVIKNFNTFMQGGKLKKTKRWTGMLRAPNVQEGAWLNSVDWFPTSETIVSGFTGDEKAVILVDVAGGKASGPLSHTTSSLTRIGSRPGGIPDEACRYEGQTGP